MRKEKWNIFVTVLLVVMLITCGCKKQENGDKQGDEKKAKGRYIENFLNIPKEFKGTGSMCLREDGSICIVDIENAAVYVSRDEGKTWDSKENKELKKLVKNKGIDISTAVPAPDGSIFISYISWDRKEKGKLYPEKYIYIGKDGKSDEFELGIDQYKTQVVQAVFSKKSECFAACNNGNIYKVDFKNHSVQKILEAGFVSDDGLFQYGDSIGACSGEKIYLYDQGTGKMDASDNTLNKWAAQETKNEYAVVIGGNDEKKLITASGSGIYSHIIGGRVMEQLAEGNLTGLGDPSEVPKNLCVTEDGTIVILYSDGKLAAYRYDSDTVSVPDRRLTICSLYDNETVRMAINEFRREHADVYIEMKIGVSGEDGVTESDAIKNLNTEMLSGKGPDILLLDGMPMDSYIEKGVLMDLSETVKELEEEETYYQNILEVYQKAGKNYAVPVRFMIPLLVGDEKIISKVTNLDTLADIVKKTDDGKRTVVGAYTPEEILKRLYPVCEGAWIKENGEVDEKALEEFLGLAKKIYNADTKGLSSSEIQSHNSAIKRMNQKIAGRLSDTMNATMQLLMTDMGRQTLTAGLFNGMENLEYLVSVVNNHKGYGYKIYNGQKENVFVPSGVLGIAEKAKNRELAVQFLKCILGKEIQGNDLEDGFPVNKTAFETFSENPNSSQESGLMIASADGNGGTSSSSLSLEWPEKKDLEQIERLFENMDTAANMDGVLGKEIIDIGSQVLSGNKERKDGAKEIAQKIALLQNE